MTSEESPPSSVIFLPFIDGMVTFVARYVCDCLSSFIRVFLVTMVLVVVISLELLIFLEYVIAIYEGVFLLFVLLWSFF
jgi:hypothetical protein